MKKKIKLISDIFRISDIYLIFAISSITSAYALPFVQYDLLQPPQKIVSWTETRDANVIKQQFDMSCGAAALATILSIYYEEQTNEADIMDIIGLKSAYSFADLAYAGSEFGYKAIPIYANFDLLTKLKIPVILYVSNFGEGHFTVFRGTDGHTVWLGDPAHGNVKISKSRFMEKWGVYKGAAHTGFALIILKQDQSINKAFFGLTNAQQQNFFIPDLSNFGR